MRQAEKLDVKCSNNGITHHPLEALGNNFHSGGIHPLVFDAFEKTNMGTKRLIKNAINTQPYEQRAWM